MRLAGEHATVIAQLEVEAIYQAQLDRIAESARIPHYLSVLTGRNTRSIMRKSRGGAADLH